MFIFYLMLKVLLDVYFVRHVQETKFYFERLSVEAVCQNHNSSIIVACIRFLGVDKRAGEEQLSPLDYHMRTMCPL